jgi:hypothetical protein
MSGEMGARLGVIQTVMQARDAAVARGACDLGEYDAQLAVLARDLQTGASPVATSAAPIPATIPGAPAAPQGLPPATVPPGSPGTSVPMPGVPAGAGGDTLSKLAGSAQSLIEKFLGGGGSAGASSSPPAGIGGAASPPPTLGAGVGTGGGTGSTGGQIVVPNPGSGPGGLVPASPAGAAGRPTIVTGSQGAGVSTPLPPVLGRRPQPARRSGLSGGSVLGTQAP